MADGMYLGKAVDPTTEELRDRFLLDPADLTTHGIIIGMTGSGKTGLSIVTIEEAVRQGIPVIVIDPKGDMGNLALAFPQLRPEDFRPWVDPATAGADGQSLDETAEAIASTWSKGLEEWGLSPADVAALVASREIRIITPGSTAGIPLNLIDSMEPPGAETLADEEEFRDQIDGVVSALLGLIGVKADPLESREYILLATLIDRSWRANESVTLESLIGQVGSPPIDRIGALPLDTVFPAADRNRLMMALNNLLASPTMAAWRQGQPVDIDSWLRTADGRPIVTIVYTSHLEEEQRVFVTALILNKLVSWVRRQPGTGELRALLYMDEIFGYFPPTANPPTKRPLITLLKQARAYGLGVLLSTQNPVDLDYRGLANMGLWTIGRLQTTQDQNRIRTGIEAALADSEFPGEFDSLIAGVQKRVFLVHDIHRRKPELVHSRFAMSFLRGPITRDEIERLTEGMRPAAATGIATPSTPAAPATPPAPGATPAPATAASAVPPIPAPMQSRFHNRNGGNLATPYLLVKASARYRSGRSLSEESVRNLAFRLDPAMGAVETVSAPPMEVDESLVTETAPAAITYGELPKFISSTGAKDVERALRQRLDDQFTADVYYDPQSKATSAPGEAIDDFARRIGQAANVENRRRTLENRIEQKRIQLGSKQDEVKARGMEKWISIGTSILSNISIFSGRKRTVTGVGGVLSKQRMEGTTRNQVEKLQAEIAELEEQLQQLSDVDTSRFETRTVKPNATDVAILRYDVLWVT
jgi:hypothetical protein